MKKAFLLLCIAVTSTVFAQKTDSLQLYKDSVYYYNSGSNYQIDYSFQLGSNTATLGALQSFFFEDFLDNSAKEELIENIDSENRFGLFSSIGGSYRTEIDTVSLKKRTGFSINAHYRNLYYGNLTQDLVETILFGNKRFAGETAIIGPSTYTTYSFTELGGKYYRTYKKDDYFISGNIGLNLLLGHQYRTIDIKQGNLFTEADGEEVILNIELEGHQSDTTSNGAFDMNGIGASLNLGFDIEYKKNHLFHFNISDLGFIRWNSQSLNAIADTTLNFEGFVINDLFDLSDSIFNPKADSLENAVFGQTKDSHTSSLPPLLRLGYTRFLDKKGYLKAVSVNTLYRFNAEYAPYLEFIAHLGFNNKHNLSPKMSFGGYNSFGIGAQYSYSALNWQFIISTDNLQSLILPNNSYGIGAFVALRRKL